MNKMRSILIIIVTAQFLCTSLWFAGNSIINSIINNFQLEPSFLGHLTSAIQFGFITGTLCYAIFAISDRFSPSKVFFYSAVAGSLLNLGIILPWISSIEILIFRFLTGFFLAGIYPVGMKIASDYSQKGLGKFLGFLVGALVLGTAFPHLLKSVLTNYPWKYVLYATSFFAIFGGTLVYVLVPDGPYRKANPKISFSAIFELFKIKGLRSTAFGYFGHMWELYTLWAFIPVILSNHNNHHPNHKFDIPFWSFVIIGLGGIACLLAGFISESIGAKKTATVSLSLSTMCCLISPLIFYANSWQFLILFLIFWGLVVIADSPMFSTLVAQNAPEQSRGTALTIVNCVGFSITIISIQSITFLSQKIEPNYLFTLLAIGPVLGLIALIKTHDL